MADIKQRIIASDETGAAYASAKKRVNEYSGSVRAGAANTAQMNAQAANAVKGVGQLRSAVSGSTEGMSRMANAAGKLIPGIAGIAGPIAIGIAAIAALKVAWTEFGLTTRLKSWFTGKPLNEIMSFSESVKKAADDYKASMARMRNARDAAFGQQKAQTELDTTESPIAKKARMARIEYEQEMEAVNRAAEDAAQAVNDAEGNAAVARKAGGMVASEDELKAIREAEAEVARKRADFAAAEEMQRTNATTSLLRYKAAMLDVAKATEDANDALKAGELVAQLEQAGFEAKSAGEYIKMAEDALAAVGKSKRLGDVLAGGLGDRGAAQALKDKQAQLAQIDEQSKLIKARTDPGERAKARELESERKRTERRIKTAEDQQANGRILTKSQKAILEEQRIIKFKADEQKRIEAAKLAAEQLREMQAAAARDKQVKSLGNIERDLAKTLQAGG